MPYTSQLVRVEFVLFAEAAASHELLSLQPKTNPKAISGAASFLRIGKYQAD